MADNTAGKKPGAVFDTLKLDAAEKLVTDTLPTEAKESADFIAGDHWQDAAGWVGPVPDLDDPDYGVTTDLIRQAFTSRNVIKEIVGRHTRGVVGDEPMIGLSPRVPLLAGQKLEDAQQQAKREIEAALTEWWDSRGAHIAIQKAVGTACWAERGVLRLYIPRGYLNGGKVPTQPTIESALSLIFLDACDPLLSAVHVDDDTKDSAGILITEIDGEKRIELSYLAPPTSAIANDPKSPRLTVIRSITKDSDETVEVEIGGRILMFSIDRELLITQQQQQMQRALNLALSMNPRTVVTAGFLERIILNALPPGHWLTDDRGKKVRFIRETWQTGPGTTQWVRGIELPQKDGSVQLTTPSVTMRDPVDTTGSDNAKRSIYRDMLEEADQAHVLVTGETTPSGKSKQEGRADFDRSLGQTAAPTNRAGRWLIETVLAMAEFLMSKPGSILDTWRGMFECQVNAGPVTVEERAQVVSERAALLISQETAMERLGVLDTQSEIDRIVAEFGVNLEIVKQRAQVIALLTGGGAVIDGAGWTVGMSDEEAGWLVATDVQPTPGLDANGNPLPDPAGNNPPTPAPPAPAPQNNNPQGG